MGDDQKRGPPAARRGSSKSSGDEAIEVSFSQIEPAESADQGPPTIAQGPLTGTVALPSSAAPAPSRVGEVLGGRYVIQRLLARGGMGAVFVAIQKPFGREVAVKVLTMAAQDEDFRRRFFREGSVLAQMAHPHVVTVFDYGETEAGELFMAMELLRGETLGRLLSREKRLGTTRAVTIAVQLARALRAAHREGVVHRDLKPANVMMLSEGEGESHDFAKVLDFGLAKPFVEVGEGDELTRSGMWLGSPRYMSPEQIRCEPIGPQSDLYALGGILFHMLAGRAPYVGTSSAELFGQHLYHPIPKVREFAPDVPEPLAELVESCLAKSMADRPASMDAFIAAIRTRVRSPAADQVTSQIQVAGIGAITDPPDSASNPSGRLTPTPIAPAALGEPGASTNPPPRDEVTASGGGSTRVLGMLAILFLAGIGFGIWLLSRNEGAPTRPAAAPSATPAVVAKPSATASATPGPVVPASSVVPASPAATPSPALTPSPPATQSPSVTRAASPPTSPAPTPTRRPAVARPVAETAPEPAPDAATFPDARAPDATAPRPAPTPVEVKPVDTVPLLE